MKGKLALLWHLWCNMGTRYVFFRIRYAMATKLGVWRWRFPTRCKPVTTPSLKEWRASTPAFFISPSARYKEADAEAARASHAIKQHRWPFFYGQWYTIEMDDWCTHPETGYQYPLYHWTAIADFSPTQGDIKYVWERARFSWAWYFLRDAAHNGGEHAALLFDAIDSFMANNPINRGPNFRCSQEISIRSMNWLAVLYYYKSHEALTEDRFQRILTYLYGSLHHVRQNISFSRIAVRNNHAITETLFLALGDHFFPWWPKAKQWALKGQRWFAEEIAYQISPDGTFLQYSMNYHRVVVQLLSWALRMEQLGAVRWPKVVHDRAASSVTFLSHCLDRATGYTPNYGANDGALFFPMSDADFRDFRPQLSVLASLVQVPADSAVSDARWYGLATPAKKKKAALQAERYFSDGGYFIVRYDKKLTFLRAGSHPHRPGQADNFHLDIWWDGKNLFRDPGTYQYNGDHPAVQFCPSTKAHNTAGLADYDQMQKGPRFTWLHWTQLESYHQETTEEFWQFTGILKAFQHIDASCRHKRTVRIHRQKTYWEIEDLITSKLELPVKQYWHPLPSALPHLIIEAKVDNQSLQPTWQEGWYAKQYATVEETPYLYFETRTNQVITTTITLH